MVKIPKRIIDVIKNQIDREADQDARLMLNSALNYFELQRKLNIMSAAEKKAKEKKEKEEVSRDMIFNVLKDQCLHIDIIVKKVQENRPFFKERYLISFVWALAIDGALERMERGYYQMAPEKRYSLRNYHDERNLFYSG